MRRSTVVVIGGTTLLLLVGALLLPAGSPPMNPRRSLSNGDPQGLLAARRYLERAGVQLTLDHQAAIRPLGERPPLHLITAPTLTALSADDVDQLFTNVSEGASYAFFLPPDAGRDQPHLMDALESFDLEAIEAPDEDADPEAAAAGLPEGEEARQPEPDEAAEGGGLRGFFEELERAVAEGATRSGRGAAHFEVLPLRADPLLGAGQRLEGSGRLAPLPEPWLTTATATPTSAGEVAAPLPFLARYEEGGLLLLFASASPLDNAHLPEADNLHLLEGLAWYARTYCDNQIVALEGFHFPHEGAGFTDHPAFSASLWQGAFAALLLLWGLGRRFGPVLPLVRDPRRSAGEYAAHLGQLMGHGAPPAALVERSYHSLRRAMALRVGISETLDDPLAGERLRALSLCSEDEWGALQGARAAGQLVLTRRLAAALRARVEGRKVPQPQGSDEPAP